MIIFVSDRPSLGIGSLQRPVLCASPVICPKRTTISRSHARWYHNLACIATKRKKKRKSETLQSVRIYHHQYRHDQALGDDFDYTTPLPEDPAYSLVYLALCSRTGDITRAVSSVCQRCVLPPFSGGKTRVPPSFGKTISLCTCMLPPTTGMTKLLEAVPF